jgi:hypothetical protein
MPLRVWRTDAVTPVPVSPQSRVLNVGGVKESGEQTGSTRPQASGRTRPRGVELGAVGLQCRLARGECRFGELDQREVAAARAGLDWADVRLGLAQAVNPAQAAPVRAAVTTIAA